MGRVPARYAVPGSHPPAIGEHPEWNAWSGGESLSFSLDQAGQERVKLRCLDHVIQRNAVVDGMGCFLIAGAKANRRNASLARPVNAVRREVPLAAWRVRQANFLACLLP